MSAIKPEPRISYILPGALTVGFIIFACVKNNPHVVGYITDGGVKLLVTSGLGLMAALMFGALFDAIRNILEGILFDRLLGKLNWRFFFDSTPEIVHQFDMYYFAYYTLDVNFVIGISFIIVTNTIMWISGYSSVPCCVLVLLGLALVIMAWDACSLRKEMQGLMNNIKEKT